MRVPQPPTLCMYLKGELKAAGSVPGGTLLGAPFGSPQEAWPALSHRWGNPGTASAGSDTPLQAGSLYVYGGCWQGLSPTAPHSSSPLCATAQVAGPSRAAAQARAQPWRL